MSELRATRTAEQLHRELSALILREIKDPRVGTVSITHVQVTRDLRLARVHVTPLGGEGDAAAMISGLSSASGYLRRLLGKALRVRHVPELQFILDAGVDEAVRMTSLLERMGRERLGRSVEGEE